jgi:hypothetical protein
MGRRTTEDQGKTFRGWYNASLGPACRDKRFLLPLVLPRCGDWLGRGGRHEGPRTQAGRRYDLCVLRVWLLTCTGCGLHSLAQATDLRRNQ